MALFLVPHKSISSFSSPYRGCIKLISIQDKYFAISITLGIWWAMLMIVQLPNLVLIILCSMTSVCVSIDAVASSSTKMRLLFRSTRPKQKSCHCPHSLPHQKEWAPEEQCWVWNADHSSQLLLCWCQQWGYSHCLVQLSWKALEWEMSFHF